MENHQMGFAEVNGAKIYFEAAGEGAAVIFIHAGVADRRMWDDQFAAFAQKYRVVRYDHRSQGKTEAPDGEYDPVKDLAGLMDFLNIQSAALVGCSIGGMVATNFTLTHPERVWALVLSGAGLGGFESPNSEADDAFEAEITAAYQAKNYERVAEMEMEMWLDGPKQPKGRVSGPIRELMFDMIMTDLRRGQEVRFTKLEPPAIRRLGEIRVPTLVIIGDADTPDILAIGDVLADGIEGVEKIVYPGVAHMLNMEIPDQFNADVLAFLAQRGLS